MGKSYVIALGGSVFCSPEGIDAKYLSAFRDTILKEIKKGGKFIIVAGGGHIARRYQQTGIGLQKKKNIPESEIDWLGIYATYLNARLVQAAFYPTAHPDILCKRFAVTSFDKHEIIIGSGWEPGWSTDFVALQIAVDFSINNVLILSKPKYIYDKNPEKEKGAKPVKEMKWDDYLRIIPSKWSPGLNCPVDPVASRLARKEKKKVIVAEGRDLTNMGKIFKEESFEGTVINP